MNKKASIGLAISTIVIVIISLVILTGGIILIQGWISGAEELKTSLDQRTQAELERLLVDKGRKVALPLHTATVEAGDNHVFGLGIFNVDAEEYGSNFIIAVDLSKVIDEQENDITSSINKAKVESWALYNLGEIFIGESSHESFPILINVPNDAIKGRYIYNVRVRYTDSPDQIEGQYDNVKKFFVTVE